MDSAVNWGSLERTSLHQVSPSWGSSEPLGNVVTLSNFDKSFSMSGLNITKAKNSELFVGDSLEYDRLKNYMTSSMGSAVPVSPVIATEEFGHWKPVYDEKTKPAFSLTGTEIWAAHMSDAAQKSKDVTENAPVVSQSQPSLPKEVDSAFGRSKSVSDMHLGRKSSEVSDARLLSRAVSRGVDGGWGTTPVSQEKPWDLCQDGAVLETGAMLPLTGLRDELNSQEFGDDSTLSLLRTILSSGESADVLSSQHHQSFERLVTPQSSEIDSVRLLWELQKLGPIDAAPQGELGRSRRGSSVSSIDGTAQLGIIGRKDGGYEPQASVQHWMDIDKHPRVPFQLDEWNLGSTGRMSSGIQSPSGWSNMSGSEKSSVVDDGTSFWGKQLAADATAAMEDAHLWTRLLKPRVEISTPVSAFSVDTSIPPPVLNARSVPLPPGVPPAANTSSLLGNLLYTNNFPAMQVNPAQGPVSPNFSNKSWMYQGPQHYNQLQHHGQRPWLGNQLNSTDAWSSMQRKGTAAGILQNKAPQTRSKLIQQLVNMGFKKEDAQNALITNNMDLDKALVELVSKHRATATTMIMKQAENLVNHAGRPQGQRPSGPRETMQGSSSGRIPFGMSGFSSDAVPSQLDFSKLLSRTVDWDSRPSNQTPMLSSTLNQSSLPLMSPLSPRSIHPSHSPPGFLQNVAYTNPLEGGFSQDVSEVALWKKLMENEQANLPRLDAELLKIFSRQASSDLRNQPEDGAAAYQPNRASSTEVGATGSGTGFPAVNPLMSGSSYSSSAEPGITTAEKKLNFDGFNSSSPSSVSRQVSADVVATTDDTATVAKDSSDSLSSSPGVALSKLTLPSALEIKEFIPGIPWKCTPPETRVETESRSKSTAMVFKDMVQCLAQGKAVPTQEGLPPNHRPSSWVRPGSASNESSADGVQPLFPPTQGQSEVKVFQNDTGSDLSSYIDPVGILESGALHSSQSENENQEFGDGWKVPDDIDAAATTPSEESLGFMTPNGLWIPTSYGEAQSEGVWPQGEETLELFDLPVCEEQIDSDNS